MSDLIPSQQELEQAMQHVKVDMFVKNRKNLDQGSEEWNELKISKSAIFEFDSNSSYVQRPSFMDGMKLKEPGVIKSIDAARILVLANDGVTTDDISPAGKFTKNTPAGEYLIQKGVDEKDFNVLGARRGNHNVMVRATFGNPQFENKILTDGTKGAYTHYWPTNEKISLLEASERYKESNTPVVIFG